MTPDSNTRPRTLFGAARHRPIYEPELTRRYAEYLTMLKRGVLLHNLNRVYYPGLWKARGVRWPLMDLAAVRYFVLVDKTLDAPLAPAVRPATAVRRRGPTSVRVYENPAALPRAYYVPADRGRAEGSCPAAVASLPVSSDRRRLALVAAAPASGFLGVSGNQTIADARFVVDDPERVVLAVDAPRAWLRVPRRSVLPGLVRDGERAVGADTASPTTPFVWSRCRVAPSTVEFRYRPQSRLARRPAFGCNDHRPVGLGGTPPPLWSSEVAHEMVDAGAHSVAQSRQGELSRG